jgi:hypothetical protein
MTVIYNLPSPGDANATLSSGNNLRYGIEINGIGSALNGKNIYSLTVNLRKTVSPSGTINAVIRRSSDDAIVQTFNGAIEASTLTTVSTPRIFILPSGYLLQNGDKILVEYTGATSVIMDVYTTADQFDGALTRRARFDTVYSLSSTQDIAGVIDDGGSSQSVCNNHTTGLGKAPGQISMESTAIS